MGYRIAIFSLGLLGAASAFAQDSISTSVANGEFHGSAHFPAARPLDSKPVVGAPYSAEETREKVQTLADGTHITQEFRTTKVYRDGSGRTRTERPLMEPSAARKQAGDEMPVMVEISDPVEHVRWILDPVNKVAHKQTVPVPQSPMVIQQRVPPRAKSAAAPAARTPMAVMVNPASGNQGPQTTVEHLENQTIEGLLVEGVRRTTVWPAGSEGNDRPIAVVSETWRSPELKVTILSTENDPRHGEVTQKLVDISRGEPDSSLFEPPSDYTISEEKADFTIHWGEKP